MISRARSVLPMPRLLQRVGLGAHANKKAECPFCHDKKKTFGIYTQNDRWYFKCQRTSCVACDPIAGHNEIGFIALHENCSEDAAIDSFMRMARELDPSIPELSKTARHKQAEEEPPIGDEASKATNVWDAVVKSVALVGTDRDKLRTLRGFSDETIHTLRFRSSITQNAEILAGLGTDWNEDALLQVGIYSRDRNRIRVNPQLCGLGLSGRNEKGESTMDWNNPILIPYLDATGNPFYIRPHKGGLRGERDDEYYKARAGGHVYAPFLITGAHDGMCVITEGEFKAAALYQCGIPALAIPGIQFSRTQSGDASNPRHLFRDELIAILHDAGIHEIVVVFDNEEKDNPKGSRYKPDPWDRFDTQVWAEYLAVDLRDQFESIRVGQIPNEWRIDGKADWDGALAAFIHGAAGIPAFSTPLGMEAGTAAARKAFLGIIQDACPVKQARELFPSAQRRIIDCKLQRLLYRPQVPKGGDKEQRLARRFSTTGTDGEPIDRKLADAFRSVVGTYYKRKAPDKSEVKAIALAKDLLQAKVARLEEDKAPAAEIAIARSQLAAKYERLKGMPEAMSDFTIACDYKLHTTDGDVHRLVRLKNKGGGTNSKLLRLAADDLCRTSNFRSWAYNTSLGVPKFGEKDLQNLVEDMDHHAAFRDIYEIDAYGWHRNSGLWFFGDCAFSPDGDTLKSDEQGIIWYDGIGYRIEAPSDGDTDTGFEQDSPLMLSPHEKRSQSELTASELFDQLAEDSFQMIGDYDAWLSIGIMLAYSIAPELHGTWGGHPGLWFFGRMSGGKTTLMRVLMRLWGFKHLDGIRIDESLTHVAMSRALAHYSCLPVWFDEYRRESIVPQKESVLRGAYDRSSGLKGRMDDPRKTRMAKSSTTPVITGESSSSDAATRSRYAHANIAATRRLPNTHDALKRTQDNARWLHRIGRAIMERRQEFLDLCQQTLNEEMRGDMRTSIPNERVRLVHCTGFAAFAAAAKLLNIPGHAGAVTEFREFVITHAATALEDVIVETFLNSFWADVISGLQRRAIKLQFFHLKTMYQLENGALRVCSDPGEAACKKVVFIQPQPVFDSYAMDIRTQGKAPRLSFNDLRRELSKEEYWITPPSDSSRAHKLKINGSATNCWAIDVDNPNFPWSEELKTLLTENDNNEIAPR